MTFLQIIDRANVLRYGSFAAWQLTLCITICGEQEKTSLLSFSLYHNLTVHHAL